jgi:hypothetical protein
LERLQQAQTSINLTIQDLKRFLGVEDAAGKDNYPKLKDYLIKLYERVGNTLRGVK